MRIIIFLVTLLPAFISIPVTIYGQLSDRVYKEMPDSIKPHSKELITPEEWYKIFENGKTPKLIYQNRQEFETIASQLEKGYYKAKDEEQKFLLAFSLGEYSVYTSNPEKRNFWLWKAVEHGGKISFYRAAYANVYLNLAELYSTQKKVDSAAILVQLASDIAQPLNDSATNAAINHTYMQIYYDLNLYKTAYVYMNKYMEGIKPAGNWTNYYTRACLLKIVMLSLLAKEEKNKTYADSIDIYRQFILDNWPGNDYWKGQLYFYLMQAYYNIDEFEKVKSAYDSAVQTTHYKTASMQVPIKKDGNFFYALSLLQEGSPKGISILDTLPLNDLILFKRANLQKAYYQYYKINNQLSKALDAFVLFKELEDSINIVGQRGKVFETEQKYQSAKKEADIAILQTKNLQQKAEKRNWTLLALLSIILLLAIYILGRRKLAQKEQKARMLEQELLNIELQMAEKQVLQISEKESALAELRQGISQNLHDEVSGSVAALRFLIQDLKTKAQSTDAKDLMNEVAKELDAVYITVRDFMHKLHNNKKEFEWHNVVDFLDKLSQTFNKPGQLKIDIEYDKKGIATDFAPIHHTESYLFIKEGVTNCIKHAGANNLKIAFLKKDNEWQITLKDNGKGYNNNGQGIGLNSMKHRMQKLGGTASWYNEGGFTVKGRFCA